MTAGPFHTADEVVIMVDGDDDGDGAGDSTTLLLAAQVLWFLWWCFFVVVGTGATLGDEVPVPQLVDPAEVPEHKVTVMEAESGQACMPYASSVEYW